MNFSSQNTNHVPPTIEVKTPQPRFTGIFIPVEILEIEELNPFEQLLLSWIDALYCKEHGGCFAKNAYLAERFKVKENTIAKTISKFRSLGLVKDVSFDGRNRVIRACIGEYVEKCQSKAALDKNPKEGDLEKNPKQGWTKIQGSVGQKSIASYIESKEDIKEEINTPPTPEGSSATASAFASPSPSQKPRKTKANPSKQKPILENISPAAKELYPKFVETIKAFKPKYIPQKDLLIMASLDEMLTIGRDPKEILRVLDWAIKDNTIRGDWTGWGSKVMCANPAAYLHGRFDQIEAASSAKKERKFAPCSDDAQALKSIQSMDKWAL